MAILAQEVMQFVKTQLDAHLPAYANYYAVAPEEATYPFLTYNVISTTRDKTFELNLEYIRVWIYAFDNKASPLSVIRLMDEFKNIFHRQYNNVVLNPTCNCKLVCAHKSNQVVQYLNEENYYMGMVEFTFLAQMNEGCP